MAARKRKGTKEQGWSDQTRSRIQTSMLLNRLTDHVDGKVEMTNSQVRAADILLRKALPDLQSVEMTGRDGDAMQIVIQGFQDKK